MSLALVGCIRKDHRPRVPPSVGAVEPLTLPARLESEARWAFVNVRLFDGEVVHPRTTVLVSSDRIVGVGEGLEIPEGAQAVAGEGFTLLPGLLDAHAHPDDEGDLEQALRLGVTTELVMGGDPAFSRRMQQVSSQGKRAEMFSAGQPLTVHGGHGTQFADLPTVARGESVESSVEARFAAGSQFLKIIYDHYLPTLRISQIQEAVRVANRHHKLSVIHIATPEEATDGVYAGVGGVVHLWWKGPEPMPFDTLRLMAERGVFLTPTLTLVFSVCGATRGPALLNDPLLSPYLGPKAKAILRARFGFMPPECIDILGRVRVAHSHGVPILAGTDSGVPGVAHGASLHEELALLVEAGLSPIEALKSATSAPSEHFHIEDRGRIKAGKLADLVLVAGNPTENILETRRIAGVWKSGVFVERKKSTDSLP